MTHILIVEDDKDLSQGIYLGLKADYECHQAYSCKEGKLACLNDSYDLILLDVNLPDGTGIELCKWIKEKKADQKIIFISANDTEDYMLAGLASGGEDYITKPFSMAVLKMKIKIILGRQAIESSHQVIRSGSLTIDLEKKSVARDGEDIKLTTTEFRLLELLITNRKQVMTREMLLEKLWDADGNYVDENALSVNIRRLRKKIELDPKKPTCIKTVFGIGYIWGDTDEA